MDYVKWSDEYMQQARNLLTVIEKKKKLLRNANADEQHSLNADIIQLRNIYYECMLTAKHLLERAGVMDNAA
ncbi:MAG: hypothetical protein IIX27_02245 [Ruminococcus sp.]|nr:hypothetical protein [Ruminococcus sp.]